VSEPLLTASGLGKRYGAVEALRGVDIQVARSEIVGFAGDNGAGKSTLLKIVAGAIKPSAGEVRLGGARLDEFDPAYARSRGIEIVYQDLALCENLDTRENIFLGREPRRSMLGLRLIAGDHMTRNTRVLLDRLEINMPSVFDPVASLSGGQRQAVAICRALAFSPTLVLMDEPTAALSINAVAPVLRLIRRLPAQGAAVILVSHRLSDLMTTTDRIYVLRNGEVVANLRTSATSEEELLRLMAGLSASGSSVQSSRGVAPE
jgi:ABC-type sugar transport system ATPase subunit